MNAAEMLLFTQLQNMNQAWQKSSETGQETNTDSSQALLFAVLLESALAGKDQSTDLAGMLSGLTEGVGNVTGTGQDTQGVLDSLGLQGLQGILGIQGYSGSSHSTKGIQSASSARGLQHGQSELESLIAEMGQKYGVDPNLIHQVVSAESGFNTHAVSKAGAMGLMQLMPGTASTYGVGDPLDPAQNLEGGTHFLRDLLDRFQGNVPLALAAYNAGPGAVDKYQGIPPYQETQNYVRKIMNGIGKFDAQA